MTFNLKIVKINYIINHIVNLESLTYQQFQIFKLYNLKKVLDRF